MKFDQDHISHHLVSENPSGLNKTERVDPEQPSDTQNVPKPQVYGLKTKIAAGVIFMILLIALLLFGYKKYKVYMNEVNSYYIPQPFTQKFEFREETLDNGLKSLYIKLNEKKEKVYIGELTSFGCWDSQ